MFDGTLARPEPPAELVDADLGTMLFFSANYKRNRAVRRLPTRALILAELLHDYACRNFPAGSLDKDLPEWAEACLTTQPSLRRWLPEITQALQLTECSDGRIWVMVAVPNLIRLWRYRCSYLAKAGRGGYARQHPKVVQPIDFGEPQQPEHATSTRRTRDVLATYKGQKTRVSADFFQERNTATAEEENTHTPADSETPPTAPCVCENWQIWEGEEAPQDYDPLQPELVLVTPTDEPEPAPACASAAEPMPTPVTTPAPPVTPPGQHLAPPPARPAEPETSRRREVSPPAGANAARPSQNTKEPAAIGNGAAANAASADPRPAPNRADFDALVAAWPNRQAIEAAWPLYRAALLADPELSPDTLRRAAERFAEKLHDQYHGDDNAIGRFAGHLRYWLRDKRWLDYPAAASDEPDDRPEPTYEEIFMRLWAANPRGAPASRDRWRDGDGGSIGLGNWGPPPGVTGCVIPPEVLAQYPDSPRYDDAFEERYKRLRSRAIDELFRDAPLTLITREELAAWMKSEAAPSPGQVANVLAADIAEGRRQVAPEIMAEICAPVRRYSDLSPEEKAAFDRTIAEATAGLAAAHSMPKPPRAARSALPLPAEEDDAEFLARKAAIIAQCMAFATPEAAAASMGASP